METDFDPNSLFSPPQREGIDKALLQKAVSKRVLSFISEHIPIEDAVKTAFFKTSTQFNFESINNPELENIVNFKRINDSRFINKVFESINDKLPIGGTFIGCVETGELSKRRIYLKYSSIPFVGALFARVYFFLYYILKRVFPKLPFFKKVYFRVTAGRNRYLTKAEALGRLYSCGFKVVDQMYHQNLLYFVAQKQKSPEFNLHPSYGLVFRMRRIGKNGRNIYVYKIRTMYPFSEYLQEYIFQNNHLKTGGKFNDDFRISSLGQFLRRFWLDEIPMMYNWLKGELKLVGVRPLSAHYLSLYSVELQDKRSQFRPGLIPPYYADLPNDLEAIMASELKYLQAYEQAPLLTDFRYFFKALFNIIFKRVRSS